MQPRTSNRSPSFRRFGLPTLLLAALFAGPLAASPAAAQATSTVVAPAVGATPSRSPSLPAPDPRLAALGAATAPLPAATLADAALIASGVSDVELPARRAALEAALAPARAAALAATGQAAQAEALLEYLHQNGPFKAYSATATTLVDILDRGLFNCVSSAVLYLIATRELGIPCVGVRTPDHAFCSVSVDGRNVDVETTTRYGFDPGTKREFTDSFGKVTGYSYVPPGDYARRETIDDRRLLSLILSNRAALLEERGRWSDALSLAVTYDAMEPGAEGKDFAVGRVNNLAASLMSRGQWAEARSLALEAKARWGSDPKLAEISAAAADGAIVAAIGAGGSAGSGAKTTTLDFRQALSLIDSALASGDIDRKRAVEFYVYLYGSEANRIGRAGDWLAAAALADEGVAKTGGDGNLVQAARSYRHNFVVSVHNRFAALFNAGRYQEAAAVAADGLAKLPGDPTLQADLKAASSAGG